VPPNFDLDAQFLHAALELFKTGWGDVERIVRHQFALDVNANVVLPASPSKLRWRSRFFA
jgi:hypothetical protein